MIEEYSQAIAGWVALSVEAAVVLIIAFAAATAFVKSVPLVFSDRLLSEDRREIWLRFATAILLALEFALAADIIRSAIAPTWDAVGKLAAIAAIRTGLNFFLARDIEAMAANRKSSSGETKHD